MDGDNDGVAPSEREMQMLVMCAPSEPESVNE